MTDKNSQLSILNSKLKDADAILIGAGAGLSTAAGFTYSGERFERYFGDFAARYGFHDMYSGGFYPFETLEEHWAYWSRYIFINRYMDAPTNLYGDLFELVKDKNYFVITINVDHCFQKAGFDKSRLFYTQGDFGLFQCSEPCHNKTYDNEEIVRKMIASQGFKIKNGELEKIGGVAGASPTEGVAKNSLARPERGVFATSAKHEVSSEDFPHNYKLSTINPQLIPHCPICGRPMAMNLRADSTFVEDDGWHEAAARYEKWLKEIFVDFSTSLRSARNDRGNVLLLELGVGYNTPGIIKYPFWKLTMENPNATYICINKGEAMCPKEIENQAICIDGDIGDILSLLRLGKV